MPGGPRWGNVPRASPAPPRLGIITAALLLPLLWPAGVHGGTPIVVQPGIVVTPLTVTTNETGTAQTIRISLLTTPTADVVIPISVSNILEGSLSTDTVVIASGSTGPATFDITPIHDKVDDDDTEYTITLAAARSNDANYNTRKPDNVVVTNTNVDTTGVTVTPAATSTSEALTSTTISVVLDSKPQGTGASLVTIGVTVSDPNEASLDKDLLTYSSGNWDTPQVVTVTGKNDFVADGTVGYTVQFAAATSSDSKYNGFDPTDVMMNNTDNDVAGIVVTPTTGLTTDETGSTQEFTVALATEPKAPVTVKFASQTPTEGAVTPSEYVFEAPNGRAAMTVTLRGVDDFVDDGPQQYTVAVTIDTSDPDYQAIDPANVTATNNDDSDTAAYVVSPTAVTTSEDPAASNAAATFTVRLATQPVAPVTLDFAVPAAQAQEGTLSTAAGAGGRVVFTDGDWSTVQTLTITGVADTVDDDNVLYTITSTHTGTDPKYGALPTPEVAVTNIDVDQAAVVVTPRTLVTSERGLASTFSVQLATRPAAPVTIGVMSADTDEVTVDKDSLIFLAGAAALTPQVVTARGVDDPNVDYARDVVIALTATSGDAKYNSIATPDVTATNNDDDSPGIEVSITQGTTHEDQTEAPLSFFVVLSTPPLQDVVVSMTSTQPAEGALDKSVLTFTQTTWDTPQTVHVQGQDDAVDDGDVAYAVAFAVTSMDPPYSNFMLNDIALTNKNNDTAGVVVSQMGTSTTEAGGTAVFTARLKSQPPVGQGVSFALVLDATADAEVSLSASALSFDSANYDREITVIATGKDDDVDDDDVTYTITIAPGVSGDSKYQGMDPNDIALINIDDDEAGVVVAPTTGLTVTELGGTATFKVSLASEPLADVIIPVSVNKPSQGSTVESILFTPTGVRSQDIVVTGLGDEIDDGDVEFAVLLDAVMSADGKYTGRDPPDVTVTNVDDDTAEIKASILNGVAPVTREDGTADPVGIAVSITTEPTADVVFPVVSSNLREGTPTLFSVTFLRAAWRNAQTVYVKGADDMIDDDNVVYSIEIGPGATSDASYKTLATTVEFTNIDDDEAAIEVVHGDDLRTREDGTTAYATVRLATQPVQPVTVQFTPTDLTEGSIATTNIEFTNTTWADYATLTVTGVDDTLDDGAVAYAVRFSPTASGDPKYSGMTPSPIPVTNDPLECATGFVCTGATITVDTFCPGRACTADRCCVPSCRGFVCTAPQSLPATANETACAAAGCDAATCCDDSCLEFSCAAGTLNVDAACKGAGCTQAACCVPACASHACSSGLLLKEDAATLACVAGCNDTMCCDATCSFYACPDVAAPLPTPPLSTIRCDVATQTCDNATCCNPTCATYDCGALLSNLPNAVEILCDAAAEACSRERCCYDKCEGVSCVDPVCHTGSACSPTSGVCDAGMPLPDNTPCTDGTAAPGTQFCTAGACVESVACNGIDCGAPTEVQCHRMVCDANACREVPKPDGAPCSDGDALTTGDQCVRGVCMGSVITCATYNDPLCAVREDAAGVVCGAGGCTSEQCCSTCRGFDRATCASGLTYASRICPPAGCTGETCCLDLCAGVFCNPSDQCHSAGTCDPNTGTCSDPTVADGLPCNDGVASTTGDVCKLGVCAGACLLDNSLCNAVEPSCNVPACSDPTQCAQTAMPDNTPCNDGKANTRGDRCLSGTCVGTPVTCGTSVWSSICHMMDTNKLCPLTGCTMAHCCVMCLSKAAEDLGCGATDVVDISAPCPPGGCNAQCCLEDKCEAVTCVAETSCHMAGVCDSRTGLCSHEPKPDGAACDDRNPATTGDRCVAGQCTGDVKTEEVSAQFAVDGGFEQLTANRVNAAAFITAVAAHFQGAVPYIARVEVHSMCRLDRAAGTPVLPSCIPGSAVMSLPETGVPSGPAGTGGTFVHAVFTVPQDTAAAAAVDIASAVGVTIPGTTQRWTIVEPDLPVHTGKCVYTVCPHLGGCYEPAVCDPAVGICPEVTKADMTSCSDGDADTINDYCVNGVCSGEVTCAGIPCRATHLECYAATCNAGVCSQVARADGTPCSDGDPATGNDRCRAGVCRGMNLCEGVACVATSQCHTDGVCEPQTGRCSVPAVPDGITCDDGDSATGGDKCVAGQCYGSLTCGTSVCFPLEPNCHTVSCENDRCVQTLKENYSPCDDQNAATIRDHCMFGKCVGEDLCLGVVCEPLNECHERGYCDPTTGKCTRPFKADGTRCDDNDPTTNGDKCRRGRCVGSTVCQGRTCPVEDPQCQTASCSDEGACQMTAKADGTPCMDLDPLTVGDRCVRGSCIGTDLCASVVCSASDSCHGIGVCDPMTGLCSDPPKPYGTQCDDGNPDTEGDKCVNHVCVGSIVCGGEVCVPPLLQCSVAVCDAGRCSTKTLDGTPCNDGNILTFDDTCVAGRCVGVDRCAGVVCRASDACHAAGTCHPKTGLCTDEPLPDGSLCDDGNAETTNDACHGGMCYGEITCGGATCAPRLPQCTTASCDGDLCAEVAKPDGTPCNDDNAATVNDRCTRGMCVGALMCGSNACVPSDPQCHMATCVNGACVDVEKPEGSQCSDGFAATINDRCFAGRCTGTTPCDDVVCRPSDECHLAGTCDPRKGVCSDPVKADGSVCNDGDPLTVDDQCVAGICVGMRRCDGQTCVPPNPVCTIAQCGDGTCKEVAKPAGTPCNDGNTLTVGDVCSVGRCVGVDLCANVTCTPSDYCHEAGMCNPLTGLCSAPFKPDGTFCSDGLFHTSDDRCVGGVCVGKVVCGDELCAAHVPQCQVPVCVMSQCTHNAKPDGTACNDGNPNTVADSCTAGECRGVDPCEDVVCSPRSECHDTGICRLGVCTQPRKPDGFSCGGGGSCFSGTCVIPVTCDGVVCPMDEPQCHISACRPEGCVLVQKVDGETCDDGDDRTAGDRCVKGACAGSVECNGKVCATAISQCHVPFCDMHGACGQKPKTNGVPCNDGNPMTAGDVCINGVCKGEDKCAGVVCEVTGSCATSTCNHRTGLCDVTLRADGAACDDGDATTHSDQCFAGHCTGTRVCSGFECPQMPLPCVESFCNERGQCDERPVADGAECSDGNDATIQDKCQGGACVGWLSCGGSVCVPSSPACNFAECVDGQCVQRKKPNGALCSDFNHATTNDVCRNGLCSGNNACASVTCIPVDTCHSAGECVPHLGICTSPMLSDGTTCDDGLASTVSDICSSGACSGVLACSGRTCKPANPRCHFARCENDVCVEVPKQDSTPCNDGLASTVNDRCVAGVCTGDDRCANVMCTARGPCRSKGTCIPQTGVCTEPIKADGTSCNDAEPGTANDQCLAGVCVGSITCGGEVCYPEDPQCHVASCSNNRCVDVVKANGVSCNDGNWSTINDACLNGVCTGEFSHCLPDPCGAGQECISAGASTAPQFSCVCKNPLLGTALNRPAICVSPQSGCSGNGNACAVEGQQCVDSDFTGQWMCVCQPPYRGVGVYERGLCIPVDLQSPGVKSTRVSYAVAAGFTPDKFLVEVAGLYRIDPSRMTVRQAGQGKFDIAFHGAAVVPPGAAYPNNNLNVDELQRKFLMDANGCQSANGFCTESRITSIDYVGTPCNALALPDFCGRKTKCSWNPENGGVCAEYSDPKAAPDSDDTSAVIHLAWIIPLVVILCCLIMFIIFRRMRAQQAAQHKARKAAAREDRQEQKHPLVAPADSSPEPVVKAVVHNSPEDTPIRNGAAIKTRADPDESPMQPPKLAAPMPAHPISPQTSDAPTPSATGQLVQAPVLQKSGDPPSAVAYDPRLDAHAYSPVADTPQTFSLPITRHLEPSMPMSDSDYPRSTGLLAPARPSAPRSDVHALPYARQLTGDRGSLDPPRRVASLHREHVRPAGFGRGGSVVSPYPETLPDLSGVAVSLPASHSRYRAEV